MRSSDRQVLLVALGAVAVLAAGLAGGVVAETTGVGGPTALDATGDQPTQIYAEEDVYTARQGDTMEMDVWVRSDGGVGDIAVESITLNATYDDSMLTVTDVETEPWLEGDEPTEVRTDVVSDGDGRVTVDQRRDPPAGGTQGNERFMTLTFEVADDAPTENTTVTFHESDVILTSQYPTPIYPVNATLIVEEGSGGGESPVDPVTGAAVLGVGAVVVLGAVAARRL